MATKGPAGYLLVPFFQQRPRKLRQTRDAHLRSHPGRSSPFVCRTVSSDRSLRKRGASVVATEDAYLAQGRVS
eukprot:scaffold1875_cov339-Prasinococcus_capsulatus_cf.AAC.8